MLVCISAAILRIVRYGGGLLLGRIARVSLRTLFGVCVWGLACTDALTLNLLYFIEGRGKGFFLVCYAFVYGYNAKASATVNTTLTLSLRLGIDSMPPAHYYIHH
jgi:hypothetical protein